MFIDHPDPDYRNWHQHDDRTHAEQMERSFGHRDEVPPSAQMAVDAAEQHERRDMSESNLALRDIQQVVLQLKTTDDAERVLDIWNRMEFAKKFLRETSAMLEGALIEWMNANGDLRLDEGRRLYVGQVKKTTCRDQMQTLEALLEKSGGDMDALVDCLASGAFKHGACRNVLGEAWDEHFIVEQVEDVKEGKATARKTVQLLDQRFVKYSTKE
jgi:hypothetical protein